MLRSATGRWSAQYYDHPAYKMYSTDAETPIGFHRANCSNTIYADTDNIAQNLEFKIKIQMTFELSQNDLSYAQFQHRPA